MARKNLTDKLQEAYRELLKRHQFRKVKDVVEVTATEPSVDILEQVAVYYLNCANAEGSTPSRQRSEMFTLAELFRTFNYYQPSDEIIDAIHERCIRYAKESRFRGLGELWNILEDHMPDSRRELPEEVVGACIHSDRNIKELLGGYSPHGSGLNSLIQKAYEVRLKGEERKKDGTPVLKRDLIERVERVQSLHKITKVKPELPEASVQSFYEECFDYDLNCESRVGILGDGLVALERLNQLTGIKPKILESKAQELYGRYAEKGLVNNIGYLSELSGIAPQIPNEAVQSGYWNCLTHMAYALDLNDISNYFNRMMNLKEITDVKPEPPSSDLVEEFNGMVEKVYVRLNRMSTLLSSSNPARDQDQQNLSEIPKNIMANLETLTGIKPLSKTYSGIRETKEE